MTRRLPPDGVTHEQRSRGIGEVLSRLGFMRRPNVLDLGAPDARNLAAYHAGGAAISVSDLFRFGIVGRTSSDELDFEALLPGRSAPFDIVLAWDVLDYLSRDEVRALLDVLSERVASQALLFLLVWTESRIPDTPSHYSILGDELLSRREHGPRERVAPRYSEHELLGLASLELERRSILRHGVVEYVLSFTP